MDQQSKRLSLLDKLVRRVPDCGAVRSIVLLGSHGSEAETPYSDIDVLIVTKSAASLEEIAEIGDAVCEASSARAFAYFNPVCERCHLVPPDLERLHIILHVWDDIVRWQQERSWIVSMWALSHEPLWGSDPFAKGVSPELNDSLLDEHDGLPGFVREIRNVIVTKDPVRDAVEYARYRRFFERRGLEIAQHFPDILSRGEISNQGHDRQMLIGLAKSFEEAIGRVMLQLKKKP